MEFTIITDKPAPTTRKAWYPPPRARWPGTPGSWLAGHFRAVSSWLVGHRAAYRALVHSGRRWNVQPHSQSVR